MKHIDVFLLDGHDRTGKDTIAHRMHQEGFAYHIQTGEPYRAASRVIFGSGDRLLTEEISQAMARVEFMQVHDKIYDEFVHNGRTRFVLPRSFLSSMAYDHFRGFMVDRSMAVISDINEHLKQRLLEKGWTIVFHPFFLHADVSNMLQRGSDLNSFEVKNHFQIDRSFETVNNLLPYNRLFFNRQAEWVYTSDKPEDIVYKFLKEECLQVSQSMV